MTESKGYESPGIAGSGAIATGLAAVSTTTAETILLGADGGLGLGAEEKVIAACAKIEGAEPSRLRVTTDPKDLADCDVVVEAIVEGSAEGGAVKTSGPARTPIWGPRPPRSASATSPQGRGCPSLYGLHVFNPVPRMALVEVCIPDGAEAARERAMAWCAALGKTAVEVPDQAGFVVNRLLFPYLFDAVRMVERTGMEPSEVDTCMKLGAGHPMGPLALLDFVGLDVAEAIGDALFADSADPAHKPPGLIVEMIGQEKLGRKSGAGFYPYDPRGQPRLMGTPTEAAQVATELGRDCRAVAQTRGVNGDQAPRRVRRTSGGCGDGRTFAVGLRRLALPGHVPDHVGLGDLLLAGDDLDLVPRQFGLGKVVPARQVEGLDRTSECRAEVLLGAQQRPQHLELLVGQANNPHRGHLQLERYAGCSEKLGVGTDGRTAGLLIRTASIRFSRTASTRSV